MEAWLHWCILAAYQPIPQYSPISHSITELLAGIIGIPLDGVHSAAITGFHNSHMVCHSISAPVEVYDRARGRDAVSILPLASGAEPFHASGAVGMLGHNAGFNVSALVGAPLYTGAECGSAFRRPWK